MDIPVSIHQARLAADYCHNCPAHKNTVAPFVAQIRCRPLSQVQFETLLLCSSLLVDSVLSTMTKVSAKTLTRCLLPLVALGDEQENWGIALFIHVLIMTTPTYCKRQEVRVIKVISCN